MTKLEIMSFDRYVFSRDQPRSKAISTRFDFHERNIGISEIFYSILKFSNVCTLQEKKTKSEVTLSLLHLIR